MQTALIVYSYFVAGNARKAVAEQGRPNKLFKECAIVFTVGFNSWYGVSNLVTEV